MAFQCNPFTGKLFERSGPQVSARRHGGLSGLSDRGVIKKSCFLFGVVFAIPRYKCKAKGSTVHVAGSLAK